MTFFIKILMIDLNLMSLKCKSVILNKYGYIKILGIQNHIAE